MLRSYDLLMIFSSGAPLLLGLSQCHNVTMYVIRLLDLNAHNFTDSNPILLRFGMPALLMTLNKLAS